MNKIAREIIFQGRPCQILYYFTNNKYNIFEVKYLDVMENASLEYKYKWYRQIPNEDIETLTFKSMQDELTQQIRIFENGILTFTEHEANFNGEKLDVFRHYR